MVCTIPDFFPRSLPIPTKIIRGDAPCAIELLLKHFFEVHWHPVIADASCILLKTESFRALTSHQIWRSIAGFNGISSPRMEQLFILTSTKIEMINLTGRKENTLSSKNFFSTVHCKAIFGIRNFCPPFPCFVTKIKLYKFTRGKIFVTKQGGRRNFLA